MHVPTRAVALLTFAALALAVPVTPARAVPVPVPVAAHLPSALPSAAAKTSDFDGDGKPDLAIGADIDMGLVHVMYGNGTEQTFTRADLDPSYTSTFSDLGAAILARDIDRDGYTDLAVGDPQNWIGARPAVFVVYGSASGLNVASPLRIDGPEALGMFGSSLALVEKPVRLLVVGQKFASFGDTRGGTLAVYPVGSNGIVSTGPGLLLSQDSAGIPGTGGDGDQFGSAVAATGSSLVVGAPGHRVSGVRRAGSVIVITFASAKKYTARQYTENSAGVPGNAEGDDQFGASVAAVTGHVAVGVPGENHSTGYVQVFTLAKGKLAARQKFNQDSPGIPGRGEKQDQFGGAVAFGRPCAGALGLLVGAWYETVGATTWIAGAAWSIPLTKKSTCTVREFHEGGSIGGTATKWASVGKAVGVLRSASTGVADTIVLAAPGETEEGVNGRILTIAPPYAGPAKTVFASPAFWMSLSPVQG